jgi:integrase
MFLLLVLQLGALAAQNPANTVYDRVILGGHLMDPASKLDAVRNIGLTGGRIAVITTHAMAFDRVLAQRPGIGALWLFPRFTDPTQPIRKELAYTWLREAETLAKLEHLPHGGWHMFRRAWATARKGLPDVDVMAVGGWSDVASLKQAYQQPDPATMFKVATEATELREKKA